MSRRFDNFKVKYLLVLEELKSKNISTINIHNVNTIANNINSNNLNELKTRPFLLTPDLIYNRKIIRGLTNPSSEGFYPIYVDNNYNFYYLQ